jgi:hypothetical protein
VANDQKTVKKELKATMLENPDAAMDIIREVWGDKVAFLTGPVDSAQTLVDHVDLSADDPDDNFAALQAEHPTLDFVHVQKEEPGVHSYRPSGVEAHLKMGYKVITEDPKVTGHTLIVVMARPKQESKKSAVMQKYEDMANIHVREMTGTEGLIAEVGKGLSLEQIGASLPSESNAGPTVNLSQLGPEGEELARRLSGSSLGDDE